MSTCSDCGADLGNSPRCFACDRHLIESVIERVQAQYREQRAEREHRRRAQHAEQERRRRARRKAEAPPRPVVMCGQCGQPIVGKRADARYCSARCRVNHNRGY